MTLARFALGVVLACVAFVPLGLGARRWRQRLLPGWGGAEGALCDLVLAVSLAVVVTELLGTIGAFRTVPLVLALAASGVGAWVAAGFRPDRWPRGIAPPPSTDEPVPRVTTAQSVVAGLITAVLIGSWFTRTMRALGHGMGTVDTLWYHLPAAVRFTQSGTITPIHHFDGDPLTAFYPLTSSLLHAVGMQLLGSDIASTVVNLGWLVAALLAAWCIGKPFGVAPVSLAGGAVLLATPAFVATQAGSAYTDVMGLALLLTACAILVQHPKARRPGAQDLIVALAAGLSLGTKFTLLGPVGVLAIAQVATAPRGRRLVRTGVVAAGLTVSGGYWYVRNTILVGNPLADLSVHLGPFSLPVIHSRLTPSTVGQFLFDRSAWTNYFVPGFRIALGPAWPAVLAFSGLGIVGGLVVRRRSMVRVLAIIALGSLVVFVVTPQLLSSVGTPFFFPYNLRYAGPAIILGLVVLPMAWPRMQNWILGAYALTFVVTELDPTNWPTELSWAVFQDRATGSDAWWGLALAIGIFAVWLARRRSARLDSAATPRRVAVGCIIAMFVGLAAIHHTYLDQRFTDTQPYPRLYAWARGIHRSRIAVVGIFMQEQYPFAGTDLSNRVDYAGVARTNGDFEAIASCAAWVDYLRRGHFQYAVIAPAALGTAPPLAATWTSRQPGSRLLRSETIHITSGILNGPITARVYHLNLPPRGAVC